MADDLENETNVDSEEETKEDELPPVDNRSPEDIEADEIERVFGPVDKKQEDVEQVTGLSEVYILRQFFILFLLAFVLAFGLLHLSVLCRPTWLPYSLHQLIVGGPLSDDAVLLLRFNGKKYAVSVLQLNKSSF